jgi:hypothetical protein
MGFCSGPSTPQKCSDFIASRGVALLKSEGGRGWTRPQPGDLQIVPERPPRSNASEELTATCTAHKLEQQKAVGWPAVVRQTNAEYLLPSRSSNSCFIQLVAFVFFISLCR